MEQMEPMRSRTISRARIIRKTKTIEDENVRLKDLLQQALSREANVLRKLKHLQMKYLQLLSKTNGASTINTKSPILLPRKLPADFTFDGTTLYSSNICPVDETINSAFPQFFIQTNSELDDICMTENGHDKTLDTNGVASLAPLPQGLRDVKQEREKPPLHFVKPVSKTPVTNRKEIRMSSSLTYTSKQKSLSHDSINQLHRLNCDSNGGNSMTAQTNTRQVRRGSFWKKKNLQIIEDECDHIQQLSIDDLFYQFQESLYSRSPDPLKKYLDQHWSSVCVDQTCSEDEKKYRDAVWEIFQAETKYLTCQLQPLEQVYKNFLEELQFHGILNGINIDKMFGNLSGIIELTSTTANDLLMLFERRSHSTIAQMSELILTFSMFGHNFNPVYKLFCTNYDQQRSYFKEFETNVAYQQYTRMCRTAPSVHKNDIHDLLITPMQHLVHYKLLLENVLKRTRDPNHRANLSSVIQAFKVSLQELNSAIEDNITSLKLKDLSKSIYWPPVTNILPETLIPQSLSEYTKQQKCNDVITDKRYLVLQETFKLLDIKGKPCTTIQLILLNDLLLVTEETKNGSNKKFPYQLLHQPFDPQYLKIHCPPANIRPLIILIPHSEYGQQLCIFSLIASSSKNRSKWITELLAKGASFITQQ